MHVYIVVYVYIYSCCRQILTAWLATHPIDLDRYKCIIPLYLYIYIDIDIYIDLFILPPAEPHSVARGAPQRPRRRGGLAEAAPRLRLRWVSESSAIHVSHHPAFAGTFPQFGHDSRRRATDFGP
jgi:hypothetical protein